MAGLLNTVDPDGLLEISVVFTDRSLNHMSSRFQTVMSDIHQVLTTAYNAHSAVIVPGGGTYAMEAVARQFANNQSCMVVRNGWFSYRWTQILEMGGIASSHSVLKARPLTGGAQAPFAPVPIDELVGAIKREKPAVLFAPHVETSAGMMLPDDYLRQAADAVHAHGGLFVLDCIASGTVWVDMKELGIDVLISAPQKGWSGSPGAGLVMLGESATEKLQTTTSNSFAIDLKKWSDIMQAYLNGGHAYHATMPTDQLTALRDVMLETVDYGLEKVRDEQLLLGAQVRALLSSHGFASVAAPGFEAPGVVVSYTSDADIQSGKRFLAQGLQTAAGVPLMCDEPESFQTFRIGLFGLDKLHNVDQTVANLSAALDGIHGKAAA